MQKTYLDTLPADMPHKEKRWLENFYLSMPTELQHLVDIASQIEEATIDTIEKSKELIDHTSLNEDGYMVGGESDEEIAALASDAAKAGTAAICTYPNKINTAKAIFENIAVVNNFPHGSQSAEEAAEDAAKAIAAGAKEIDTVVDYRALLHSQEETVRDKIRAVSTACRAENVPLKVILKASVLPTYVSLQSAAKLAIEEGADFVKTCTGKMPHPTYGADVADASNLLTMATVMKAVADYNNTYGTEIGVKISGGVKTPLDCEKLRYLSNTLLGASAYESGTLRIGASSLLKNLQAALNPDADTKAAPANTQKLDY